MKPPGTREFTIRAVIAGIVVAAIMGASYPYIVLKLGFGPNVSVVAAFFGYLFLGILFRNFNRWENNIVQTAGTSAAQTAFMCVILAAFDLLAQKPGARLHVRADWYESFLWLDVREHPRHAARGAAAPALRRRREADVRRRRRRRRDDHRARRARRGSASAPRSRCSLATLASGARRGCSRPSGAAESSARAMRDWRCCRVTPTPARDRVRDDVRPHRRDRGRRLRGQPPRASAPA